MRRININDVAREAGVAVSTASMALRGDSKIKLATREKLKLTAERLGYVPNFAARTLAGGKTNSIGIVIPAVPNSIYAEEAFELRKHVEFAGYKFKIFMVTLGNIPDREFFINTVCGNVDGIICYPLPSEWGNSVQEVFENSGIKCVYNKFSLGKTDWVSGDYEKGGYMAVDYLLRKGHRKIGVFSTGVSFMGFPDREEGICRAFSRHGLPFDRKMIFSWVDANTVADGYEVAKRMLSWRPRPTALFMRADFMALGALKAASDIGLEPGKDIDIMGFDNIEYSAFSNPALTTIGYDRKKKARIMMEILLRRIAGDKSPPENIMIEPELIIRESA